MATLEQVIQIDAKQFKSDTHMGTEDEVLQHVNHIELVFSILSSHQCDTNTSLLHSNFDKEHFFQACTKLLSFASASKRLYQPVCVQQKIIN